MSPFLQFNLTSAGISVTGSATTQAELAEFIRQLTSLLPVMPDVIAQGIEAPSGGETGTGSTEGESAVPERNAP